MYNPYPDPHTPLDYLFFPVKTVMFLSLSHLFMLDSFTLIEWTSLTLFLDEMFSLFSFGYGDIAFVKSPHTMPFSSNP